MLIQCASTVGQIPRPYRSLFYKPPNLTRVKKPADLIYCNYRNCKNSKIIFFQRFYEECSVIDKSLLPILSLIEVVQEKSLQLIARWLQFI